MRIRENYQFFLVPLCTPQGGIGKNLGGKNRFGYQVIFTRLARRCSFLYDSRSVTAVLKGLRGPERESGTPFKGKQFDG